MKKLQSQQDILSRVWEAYENGKDFKRRIGLYSRVSENERFYRGDQWSGIAEEGLPKPTFNLIRRVTNYLVSSVMGYQLTVRYEDPAGALTPDSPAKRAAATRLIKLERYRTASWERMGMDRMLRQALTDAVLTGDGVFYVWYDAGEFGEPGQVRITTMDNVSLFAADMNLADIQSQDFILLCGRCSVDKLRREALAAGLDPVQTAKIVPDDPDETSGGYGSAENADEDAGKATYLIRFSRDEQGFVVYEKCTRNVVIRSGVTGLHRYPVAAFPWEPAKNCFHGSSPVSELIGNQKYVNKAFAMEMKHMIDTAFSKVIYDKRLIPEWTNEVGQAIGVLAGGDVSGAVATVGVGEMQDGYVDIIDRVITYTKEMAGATETALGEVDPTNTSAILTLKETADQALDFVRASLAHCIEELALIWLEMVREYLPDGVGGLPSLSGIPVSRIRAVVQTGPGKRYSGTLILSTLNNLLANGQISLSQYLRRLPDGIIPDREGLLAEAVAKEKEENQNGERDSQSTVRYGGKL